jgi:hypothetical protein
MLRKIIPTVGVLTLGCGLMASPVLAQQQPSGVQGALQGLLSGNQSQDQAVRDAYERGYQRGRQDEARMGRSTRATRPNDDYGSADRSGSGYGRDYQSNGNGTNYNR